MNVNLSIQPVDTLFFRDGKPFSMGDESWADGLFPPLPSTVLGAIRTWAISLHPDGLTPQMVDWARRNVRLKQMRFLIHNKDGGEDLYFPMPLDMVQEVEKRQKNNVKEYEMVSLQVQPVEKQWLVASSYRELQMSHLLAQKTHVERISDGLILHSDLMSYLNGVLPAYVKVCRIKDYKCDEPKTGIGRSDETNAVAESMLYRVGMVRPQNMRFLVEVELPDDLPVEEKQAYTIKFGAENKVAELRKWKRENVGSSLLSKDIELSQGRFKLYLAGPAVFEQGWKPDLSKHGIEASLVAAVVGKPLFVGGYDMAAGKPKPMVRAVPAGSVYYYETEEPLEKIKEKLFGKSISEKIIEKGSQTEIDLAVEGFGMAYVGRW